jgi:hypothetical protein
MKTRTRCSGIRKGSISKEVILRSSVLGVLALFVSGCSFLDQINFGAPSLSANKIYLRQGEIAEVRPREDHRFACTEGALLCVQYGAKFECRCP